MGKTALRKQNMVSWAAFLLGVFAVSWALTSLTPLVSDDFSYAFSWAGGWRVRTFEDLWLSMSVHRDYQHGRVFSSGWATIFMMGSKWVFNLANAAVTTLFAATLHHYFRRVGTKNPVLSSLAVFALYWVCMPAFGQVFLWLDGSTNYFWGAALAWFLLEAELSLREKERPAMAQTLLLLPLAFAVGAWSEHISFAALAIQALFLLRLHLQKKKFPFREWLILLVTAWGYYFLMFAPSMLGAGLSQKADSTFSARMDTLLALMSRFRWIVLALVLVLIAAVVLLLKKVPTWRQRGLLVLAVCGFGFLAVSLGFAVLALLRNGMFGLISSTELCFFLLLTVFLFGLRGAILQQVDRSVIWEATILCLGGLSAMILFVVGARYIPARGFCAPVIFAGIASVRLWSAIAPEKRKLASVLLCVCAALCFSFGLADILRVHSAALERDAAIAEALRGDGVLYTSPYPQRTRFSAQHGVPDLQEGSGWPNAWMCIYYGLNDIHVLDGSEGK